MSLIDYGIQNEQSDIRAHVCPIVQRIYIFKTDAGRYAIDNNGYPLVPGFQPGCNKPTASGYLVPPFDIEGCVGLVLRPIAWKYIGFSDDDSLSTKGTKAVRLVIGMIRKGLFPLAALAQGVTDVQLDIDGDDITVYPDKTTPIHVQVKCDYPGGEKQLGGTGNLFLQIAERNPFSIY